jgi:hypothetical protein
MKYEDLSIHQRITAKGMIKGVKGYYLDVPLFNALHALWVLTDFKQSVEMLLFKMNSPTPSTQDDTTT